MFKNTKKQGDAGIGIAVGWFAANGHTVAIPLTDSQDYDLVVDLDGLKRVQVKTTTYKEPSGNFFVSLTVKGGNRSGKGKIKRFDSSRVDYIFIVTAAGENYLIPANKCGQTLTLNASIYGEFKLNGGVSKLVTETDCKSVAMC